MFDLIRFDKEEQPPADGPHENDGAGLMLPHIR